MTTPRETYSKRVILEAVRASDAHPTVDTVYEEVRKIHPSVSKNTVYRNLHQLAENGEIKRVYLPDGLERYDRMTKHHYHFICDRCGKIIDIEVEYLDDINEIVQDRYRIQIYGHDIVFQGICARCREIDQQEIDK